MQTDELVKNLRGMLGPNVGPILSGILEAAAMRLTEYEADRVHGHADLAAFQLTSIKMQAKLLSDAYDIFERSGEKNASAWHSNIARTVHAYNRGDDAVQADTLRAVVTREAA